MNLRVADIQACYEQWSSKGAEFRHAADRSRSRDPLLHARPRRHMIEVGQDTGVLHGELVKKRPEDLPG